MGISRVFAEIPEFRGSATARNIRSPAVSESLVDEGIFNKVKGIKMQSLDFKRKILEPKSTSTSSIMFFTSQESKFK